MQLCRRQLAVRYQPSYLKVIKIIFFYIKIVLILLISFEKFPPTLTSFYPLKQI